MPFKVASALGRLRRFPRSGSTLLEIGEGSPGLCARPIGPWRPGRGAGPNLCTPPVLRRGRWAGPGTIPTKVMSGSDLLNSRAARFPLIDSFRYGSARAWRSLNVAIHARPRNMLKSAKAPPREGLLKLSPTLRAFERIIGRHQVAIMRAGAFGRFHIAGAPF